MIYPEDVDILSLPVKGHDMTVGEYLALLAIGLVQDTVTAKHGFTGSSDWRHDLYNALADGRVLERNRNGDVVAPKAEALLSTALLSVIPGWLS